MTQLSDCWYEHALLDERLRVRVGKHEANAESTTTDAADDFPGASFGMPPMALIPSYQMMDLSAALLVGPVSSVGDVLHEWASGPDGDYGSVMAHRRA